MKVKVIKVGVTLDNSVVDVNAVIEVPDADAKRLINTGYAEAVKAKKKADERTEDKSAEHVE